MTREELFIHTLEDIERRLQSKDEYEILMIAGLLRKLLLDRESVVDIVNRKKRSKISFTVNDREPPQYPRMTFWSVEDGFDPDTALAPRLLKPININKDQLLARPVMIIDGHVFSVKDLILHVSNIQGSIHAGDSRTDKEKTLTKLAETIFIGGLPAGIRLLRAVARVVLKGLDPLKTRVLEGLYT